LSYGLVSKKAIFINYLLCLVSLDLLPLLYYNLNINYVGFPTRRIICKNI